MGGMDDLYHVQQQMMMDGASPKEFFKFNSQKCHNFINLFLCATTFPNYNIKSPPPLPLLPLKTPLSPTHVHN